MPVLAVEVEAALLVVPTKARKTALDGRDREGRGVLST
jgi:hypothetical protein